MTSESGQPNTETTVHIQTTLTKAEYVTLLLLCFYGLLDMDQSGLKLIHARYTLISRRVFGQLPAGTGPLPPFITFDVILTPDEYNQFLLLCGWGTGATERMVGPKSRWQSLHVINQVFGGIPSFQKYTIPQEYRWQELQ